MSLSSLKLKWILVIGLLIVSLVMPVMATSGSFDSVGGMIGTSYDTGSVSSTTRYVNGMWINNIQNQTGLTGLYVTTFHSGTSDSSSGGTNVNLYAGNTAIGTAHFGYTKNSGLYFLYLDILSLDIGTLSGNEYINFTDLAGMPTWNFDHLSLVGFAVSPPVIVNTVYFGNGDVNVVFSRYYTKYQSQEFHNTWITSYAAPISTVNVTKVISGMPYPSKVYVMEGTTVLSSNTTLTTDPFTANLYGVPYFTINVTDMWGNWYVSPQICPIGVCGLYNISVLPANMTPAGVTLGGITSTIDPFLSAITSLSWKWIDDTGLHNFYEGGQSNLLRDYTKISGSWFGYDSLNHTYSSAKGTTILNPVTLSNITGTGNKTISCNIYTSDGNYYTLTAPLTVGGTGGTAYTTTYAAAVDYSTGAYISDATVAFQKVSDSSWYSNVTTGGQNQISSPSGIYLNIVASAPGYGTVTRTAVTASKTNETPMYYELGMFPVSALTGSNLTTFYVSVTDKQSGQVIPLASVLVTNTTPGTSTLWYSILHNTGTNGIATFSLTNQTLYQVTAQKTGYNSLSKYVYVLSGTVATTDIELTPSGAPIPTSTIWTPVQVTTTIPGYYPTGTIPGINYTIPGAPPVGAFTGFWAPFQNAAVAMGASPSSVGILLSMFLTMICLIIGFQVGGMPGGEMGGILGLIFSVAFGFFPLAIAIVTVVGIIGYVALRFWGVTR